MTRFSDIDIDYFIAYHSQVLLVITRRILRRNSRIRPEGEELRMKARDV